MKQINAVLTSAMLLLPVVSAAGETADFSVLVTGKEASAELRVEMEQAVSQVIEEHGASALSADREGELVGAPAQVRIEAEPGEKWVELTVTLVDRTTKERRQLTRTAARPGVPFEVREMVRFLLRDAGPPARTPPETFQHQRPEEEIPDNPYE